MKTARLNDDVRLAADVEGFVHRSVKLRRDAKAESRFIAVERAGLWGHCGDTQEDLMEKEEMLGRESGGRGRRGRAWCIRRIAMSRVSLPWATNSLSVAFRASPTVVVR